MSNFWDNNKGSIMSGLSTAGKYGYQGTKAVAKAGYKAGKTHYNNSQGRKNTDDDSQDNYVSESVSDVSRLQDPRMFPPPPLRPGQKQITSDGQIIDAGNAPLVQAAACPMGQAAPVSAPGLPYRSSTASAVPVITQQPPLQTPQPVQQPMQQPMQQQLPPQPIPARNYQNATEPHPQNIPVPSFGAQLQEQLQQQFQQHIQPTPAPANQTQQSAQYYSVNPQQQSQSIAQPQIVQYQQQPVPSPGVQNQEQPLQQLQQPQQQQYFQPQQYVQPENQYQQQGIAQIQQRAQPQPPQQLQSPPQYQQQVQSPPQYQQQMQSSGVQSPGLAQQNFQPSASYQPKLQTQVYQQQPAPASSISPSPPILAPRPNLPNIQTTASHALSQESVDSSPSSITVKPYVWMDPEERKQKKRIELPAVNPESTQKLPPLHKDRPSSSSLKSSSMDASVLEMRKSHSGDPASPARFNSPLPTNASSTTSSVVNEEVKPREGITGIYRETAVNFPPPPKPTHNGMPKSPPVSNVRPAVSHKTSNAPPPRPPVSSKPSVSSAPIHKPVASTQRAPRGKAKDEVSQAAVLGAYNYDVEVGFVPPPRPSRSSEVSSGNGQSSKTSAHRLSQSSSGGPKVPARTLPPPPVQQKVQSTQEPVQESALHTHQTQTTQPAMTMLPLSELPACPRRVDSHSSSTQPEVPSRTFDPPVRYKTNETLPPAYKDKDELINEVKESHAVHKKAPPNIPKKKDSLRTNSAKPPVPKKKPTLSGMVPNGHREPANSPSIYGTPETSNEDTDDDDSGEGNSFKKYLKHAVPAEKNHIHKNK
ncbi:unnamed protein product [Kluyveromyces dobzhanskii CBS 2104]|uniref:WGS project CCBQ000000000 data, contig 00053 n=1 Tax=Kluyveromyces dobzhanskii CBS 2104 TaxID=1427455 RepID=A0A0A8L2W5_9SACH|nr:unnamed protein product [Kluyveromyces dobzhanskii CBS 2104]